MKGAAIWPSSRERGVKPDQVRRRLRKASSRAAVVIVSIAMGCCVTAPATSAVSAHAPNIAPIQSHPRGQGYAEWAVDWWQWALETPAPTNPFGSGSCETSQTGRVWFLAGVLFRGFAERTCTVPRGTALFFPVWNNFYGAFLNDPPEQRTPEFILNAAACTASEIFVEIDGVPVRHPKRFYVSAQESGLFNIQLPKDNVLGVDESVIPELRLSPSAQSGYYLFLRPLRPGPHIIHWRAKGTCFGREQAQQVTYMITVVPRRG
jgi:hypothetical protein